MDAPVRFNGTRYHYQHDFWNFGHCFRATEWSRETAKDRRWKKRSRKREDFLSLPPADQAEYIKNKPYTPVNYESSTRNLVKRLLADMAGLRAQNSADVAGLRAQIDALSKGGAPKMFSKDA